MVQMANMPDASLKQLGEEMGVSPHLLGRWRKQLGNTIIGVAPYCEMASTES